MNIAAEKLKATVQEKTLEICGFMCYTTLMTAKVCPGTEFIEEQGN